MVQPALADSFGNNVVHGAKSSPAAGSVTGPGECDTRLRDGRCAGDACQRVGASHICALRTSAKIVYK